MLSRLKRLEGVIEDLRGNTAKSTASTAADMAFPILWNDDIGANKQLSGNENGTSLHSSNLDPNELQGELGRLVIEEGRSRYVSSRLWASLGDEVGAPLLRIIAWVLIKLHRSRSFGIF